MREGVWECGEVESVGESGEADGADLEAGGAAPGRPGIAGGVTWRSPEIVNVWGIATGVVLLGWCDFDFVACVARAG